MVASSLPLERPRGSKKPMGAVIPTTVSSAHADNDVERVCCCEGAKAALRSTKIKKRVPGHRERKERNGRRKRHEARLETNHEQDKLTTNADISDRRIASRRSRTPSLAGTYRRHPRVQKAHKNGLPQPGIFTERAILRPVHQTLLLLTYAEPKRVQTVTSFMVNERKQS